MVKYQIEQQNSIDDIQGVSSDINELYQKFISPIELIRSSAITPSINLERITEQDNSITINEAIIDVSGQIQIDSSNPVESRTHAFYRMIGLPVMDKDGNFYNPGFNPDESSNKINHFSIVSNINDNVKNLQNDREFSFIQRKLIFAKQSVDATAYSLALRFTKPFNNIKTSDDPFEYDQQKFVIDDRVIGLDKIFQPNGEHLPNTFKSGSHILKPFVVNPITEAIVTPSKNKICVPFLKNKDSTRLERDTFISRPILEFVCRNRLTTPPEQESLIANLSSVTTQGNNSTNTISGSDLTSIVLALLGENNIDSATVINATGNPSSYSLSIINDLIKQLKIVVKLLSQSLISLDQITGQDPSINFYPITNESGPEFGCDQGLLTQNDNNTLFEKRILAVQIKKEISQNSNNVAKNNIGDYAGSFYQNTQINYQDQYDSLIEQRNELAATASNNVRNIEIITGEINGLGLVDIISIYTALWSVPINVLIGLLDQDAFNRLIKYNSNLITVDVQNRINNSPTSIDGKTALVILEHRIVNILSFADHLLAQNLISPFEASSGGL